MEDLCQQMNTLSSADDYVDVFQSHVQDFYNHLFATEPNCVVNFHVNTDTKKQLISGHVNFNSKYEQIFLKRIMLYNHNRNNYLTIDIKPCRVDSSKFYNCNYAISIKPRHKYNL